MWCHHCCLILMSCIVKIKNKKHSRRIRKSCCLDRKRNTLKNVINKEINAIKEKSSRFYWDKKKLARPHTLMGQKYEMARSWERLFLRGKSNWDTLFAKDLIGKNFPSFCHPGIHRLLWPLSKVTTWLTDIDLIHEVLVLWTYRSTRWLAGSTRWLRLLRFLRMCMEGVVFCREAIRVW